MKGTESHGHEFKPWEASPSYHFLTDDLTALYLGFLLCQMGIIVAFTSRNYWKS